MNFLAHLIAAGIGALFGCAVASKVTSLRGRAIIVAGCLAVVVLLSLIKK